MIMMMMMMMMIIMVMMMMTMMMMRPRGLLNCQVQGLVPRPRVWGQDDDNHHNHDADGGADVNEGQIR